MTATQEQRSAIEIFDRALLVEAGAGTGKTWVLVERFLHLLEEHPDWPLDSLVAITFTEKAAREMRSRIRRAVEERARQASPQSPWHQRRAKLDSLRVSTIHSLCAHLLRENAIAAGIDPRFDVLDEQDAQVLQEEAVSQTLAQLVELDDPALALLLSLRVADLRGELAILLSQRGSVDRLWAQLPSPEVLLTRWRKGLQEARQAIWDESLHSNPDFARALEEVPAIPIVDPNDKLAEWVRQAQLGCDLAAAGDLAAAASSFLPIKLNAGRAANWGGSRETLADLKALLKALRGTAKAMGKAGFAGDIGPEDEAAAGWLQHWQGLWRRLTTTYDRLKDDLHKLDFDDLEILAERLLRERASDARLQAFRAGINHLMVDEFQDTNQRQQEIVYALAHPADGGRLFVVGDAKQSIYRFRQAQVSVFNRTGQDIEEATGYPALPLSRSFRSHGPLLDVLNETFQRILQPQGTDYQDFEARPSDLTAHRPDPPSHPAAPAPVELLVLPRQDQTGNTISSEEARLWEAQLLAQRLQSLRDSGLPVWDKKERAYRAFHFDDAAILFRATTSLPLYEEVFKALGLPYLTVSGRGYYDRPEVHDLIALLAALHNPRDDLSVAHVLRSPLFSLSDETLYRLRWHTASDDRAAEPIPLVESLASPPPTDQARQVEFSGRILDELWDTTGRVDVWQLLRRAVDRTGYEATMALVDGELGGTGRQRSNMVKFLAMAREFASASLSDFLRRVQDLQAREAREGEAPGAPDAGAVQLMSVHGAKGLEFPVVAVADLGRRKGGSRASPRVLHDPQVGVVSQMRDENGDWQKPASYCWAEWVIDRMEEAESRRLLYVACTRAADLLILSGKAGENNSWLTDLLAAWQLEALGAEEELAPLGEAAVRVLRPTSQPEPPPAPAPQLAQSAGLAAVPRLAGNLPRVGPQRPLAAAQLARLWPGATGELPDVRPVVRREQDGSGVPAFAVGRIVHRALADWNCLTSSRLRSKLKGYARQEGILQAEAVERAVARSLRIIQRLRRTWLFVAIQEATERHHELPFTLETELGPLHGALDLLYRGRDGRWYLVDWKTDWVAPGALPDHVADHRLQMAAYFVAAQRLLGQAPSVSLCFLAPRVEVESLPGPELADWWQSVLQARFS